MARNFFLCACACAISIAIFPSATRAQEARDIHDVASPLQLRDVQGRAALPSLSTSNIAFVTREGALASIEMDDPALAGMDPATAELARLSEGRWVIENVRLDLERRRLLARLEPNATYAFIGASRSIWCATSRPPCAGHAPRLLSRLWTGFARRSCVRPTIWQPSTWPPRWSARRNSPRFRARRAQAIYALDV